MLEAAAPKKAKPAASKSVAQPEELAVVPYVPVKPKKRGIVNAASEEDLDDSDQLLDLWNYLVHLCKVFCRFLWRRRRLAVIGVAALVAFPHMIGVIFGFEIESETILLLPPPPRYQSGRWQSACGGG